MQSRLLCVRRYVHSIHDTCKASANSHIRTHTKLVFSLPTSGLGPLRPFINTLREMENTAISVRYFCVLGPATPAPITLGNSSLPILYSRPIAPATSPAMTTLKLANSTNGTETSFF